MKADIHPKLNPVAFVDVSTGTKYLTRSTMHPAFTGEKRFVDTAGRVEKFQNKFSRRR